MLSRHIDLENAPVTPNEGGLVFSFEVRIADQASSSKIVGSGFGLPGLVHQRVLCCFAGKEASFETGLDRIEFLQLIMFDHSEVKLDPATDLLSHLNTDKDCISYVI